MSGPLMFRLLRGGAGAAASCGGTVGGPANGGGAASGAPDGVAAVACVPCAQVDGSGAWSIGTPTLYQLAEGVLVPLEPVTMPDASVADPGSLGVAASTEAASGEAGGSEPDHHVSAAGVESGSPVVPWFSASVMGTVRSPD